MKGLQAIATLAIISGTLVGCSTTHAPVQNQVKNQTAPTNQANKNPNLSSASATIKGTSSAKLSGVLTMTYDKQKHTLTVASVLSGLTAKAKYTMDIESSEGKTLYSLKGITADKSGSGTSLTVLKDVQTFNPKGWTVQVHPTAKHSAATVVATGSVHS